MGSRLERSEASVGVSTYNETRSEVSSILPSLPHPQRCLVFPEGFGDNGSMSSLANVLIHSSQFPENVRRDLLESLRSRQVNHKFHYDSVKQTQKWLALHQAHSPSRNDADCLAIYDRCFETAVQEIPSDRV